MRFSLLDCLHLPKPVHKTKSHSCCIVQIHVVRQFVLGPQIIDPVTFNRIVDPRLMSRSLHLQRPNFQSPTIKVTADLAGGTGRRAWHLAVDCILLSSVWACIVDPSWLGEASQLLFAVCPSSAGGVLKRPVPLKFQKGSTTKDHHNLMPDAKPDLPHCSFKALATLILDCTQAVLAAPSMHWASIWQRIGKTHLLHRRPIHSLIKLNMER